LGSYFSNNKSDPAYHILLDKNPKNFDIRLFKSFSVAICGG
jgi:hypothetical protein